MILGQTLAFVDVETTGTDSSIHEIIELGLVLTKLRDGELVVIDELDIKIMPKYIERADPVALRINGYTPEDWLFAFSMENAMKIFVEKTAGAVLVAHNVTFDFAFIDNAFKQCDMENMMHFHKIDTLSMAFAILHNQNDMSKLSLRALCEHYGIENKKAHSAFADAYATYEVFKKLLNLK